MIKFDYLSDIDMEVLNVVGGGFSSCKPTAPKEIIKLNQCATTVSKSNSNVCLSVSRTGKGAGQGNPVSISLA